MQEMGHVRDKLSLKNKEH